MNKSGGELLVEALLQNDTNVVFGYPGGAIMPIYDALHGARNRLRHVLVRHEQGATHAAQGYARASGKVGVCMATSGPGATNMITGLMDALMDSTPMIAITGQVASEKLGTDAFQEADVVGLTLAATKWSYQITDPAEIPRIVAQAFDVATSGRPGPVLIDITRDAQSSTVDAAAVEPVSERIATVASVDATALQEAASLINDAHRPLMFVGQGVLLSGARDAARAVSHRGSIPVASTLLGLSAIETTDPMYVGMLGMHGHYAPNMLTNEADVILAVGMRFDDRVTGRLDSYARQARIVHIEVDPAEVNRHVPAEVPIVADARVALEALLPLLEPRHRDAWRQRFRDHERMEHEAVIEPETCPTGEMMTMGEVVERISEATGGTAVIVSDVGQHQMMAARHYHFGDGSRHITSGGLGTMGFALPAALGAKVADPASTVIAIIGDGGFQMTLQELGTLMQERIAVKMVILNNEHLGMVRQWQELFFDGRYSEVAMMNPDFVQICSGFGIAGERVVDRDSLGDAVDRMMACPGPYLLDVQVGKTDNVFPMIAAGAAVDEIRLR